MEEELTTLMHMEFCKDEQERVELAAMAIFAEVFEQNEITFEDALKRYSITEKQFFDNMPYDHIFTFAEKSFEDLQKDWHYFTKEKYEKYKACKDKIEICRVFVSYRSKEYYDL